VPKAVGLLVKNGHKVLVENDAGKAAHFSDNEYSEAGGQIVNHSEEIFKADIILKVAPLTDNEIKLLKSKQAIFSSLQLPSQDKNYFKKLITKKSTAIAFEKIQDKSGTFPVIRSISEIIGATSIFIAAEYLCNPEYGKGSMLGGFTGITPTEVVILGAGTVAENAARVAMGMVYLYLST
jgi:alanine dehydrogenase